VRLTRLQDTGQAKGPVCVRVTVRTAFLRNAEQGWSSTGSDPGGSRQGRRRQRYSFRDLTLRVARIASGLAFNPQQGREVHMGLMPSGAANPFTKLDKQAVLGMIKTTGSRDPDVLHALQTQLLSQPKQLKLLGVLCIVIGAFFTVTVVLAIAGIPFMIFGVWLWRFGSKNVEAVDGAFAEYASSVAG
jgi:hypothetical protein